MTLLLILIFLTLFFMYRTRSQSRVNYLEQFYDVYTRNVYPFHRKIGKIEREYISNLKGVYDYYKEFRETVHISPYSFSISIDKETNKVNLTRVNIGSVESDITSHVEKLLRHIGVDTQICAPNYKYYGVGWDLVDEIIKFYTLSNDKSKIECYVYKVKRDAENEIVESKFETKKEYDVGKKNTVMHKNGKKIDQKNLSRVASMNTKHPVADDWIKKMKKLGFMLDTHSDYDGKINLYFD